MFYCKVQITECLKWENKAALVDLYQHEGSNKKCPHKDKEQMSELGWSNVLKTPQYIGFME